MTEKVERAIAYGATMNSRPSSQPDHVTAALTELLDTRVITDPSEAAKYRQDTWVIAMLRDRQDRGLSAPRWVVEPESTEEVSAILALASRHGVPVITRGGGSGVVGGVEASGDCIVLSTTGIGGLRSVNLVDRTATFGAGINGMEAEQLLQDQGFTMGHWPQSITLSTVGGWVATRASGQLSTANGNIEDVVVSVTAVLASGAVVRTSDTPRAAAGPDLLALIMGSEGTLAVITEVTFHLLPLPTGTIALFITFADFAAGLEGIRQMMHAGLTPAVVRLYDPTETRRNFGEYAPESSAGLVLVCEGRGPHGGDDVAREAQRCVELLASVGGVSGDPAPAVTWFENKSHAPSAAPFLEKEIVVDTIEVAAPWSRIGDVFDAVIRDVSELDDVLAITGHSSHSYQSGTNIYFSFGVRCADPGDLEAAYHRVWDATMAATVAHGGGISHHHGIGRIRRPWMRNELGDGGLHMLQAVRSALDPQRILNPEVLVDWPDEQPHN